MEIEKAQKTSVRITPVPTEIRTKYLRDVNLDPFLQIDLFGKTYLQIYEGISVSKHRAKAYRRSAPKPLRIRGLGTGSR